MIFPGKALDNGAGDGIIRVSGGDDGANETKGEPREERPMNVGTLVSIRGGERGLVQSVDAAPHCYPVQVLSFSDGTKAPEFTVYPCFDSELAVIPEGDWDYEG